jgi:WD40 repeat protein
MCEIENKQLVMDKDLNDGSIWSIALTDESVYSAGQAGTIRRFQLGKFDELKKLEGHSNEVNVIILSRDYRFLFSCSDDFNVFKWNLGENPTHRKLYHHFGSVYGMDLAEDGNNLASCSADGTVKVFHLVDENIKFEESVKDVNLWCVKISAGNKFLIVGGSDGVIRIWNFGDWKNITYLRGHTNRVRCLDVSSDGNTLVSGGIDNLIKVWDLVNYKDEYTIYGHQDWVKAVLFSKDGQSIHSLSDDCTIMTSKVPKFDVDINVKTPTEFKNFMFNTKNNIYYSVSAYKIHKSYQGHFEDFQICREGILSAHLVKDSTEFIIFLRQLFSTQIEVRTYSLTEKSEKSRTIKTSSLVSSTLASDDGRLLFTGEAFRITIWDNTSGTTKAILKSHLGDVTALELRSNHLFAGDSKGIVKYYHLSETTEEISQFVSDSAEGISEIRISRNLQTLVYSTENNLVFIWSIPSKTLVKMVYLDQKVKKLCITNDSLYLLFAYHDKIDFWNLECFSRSAQLVLSDDIQTLALKDNESHLLVGFSNYVKFLQNPLRVTQFSIFGHQKEQSKFFNYVNKIIDGEVPKYDESMNKWLVEPYHMNILHIYAYFNMNSHIQKGLESGATFFPSRTGTTPISISVDKKFQDCTETFFEHFKRKGENDPFLYYYLSESLTGLNRSSHPKLHLLYEQIFRKSFNFSLPRFCENGVDLPIVKVSKKIVIPRNKYLKDQHYRKEEKPVEFFQSYSKIPVVPGSGASLEFLSSLNECKNLEVFNSGLVKLILEEKWKTVKCLYAAETFLYLVYLVMFCVYSVKISMREDYLLIPAMAINVVLFLNEILQMVYSRSKYFKNFWNYIDLIRFLLFSYFFITAISGYHEKFIHDVLMISTLSFSLIRGISYFRIHPSTRWVISLIFDVFFNLWAMLSVALYAIFALFMFYYCASAEYSINDLNHKFTDIEYEWFMIFSVVIINPMIILNLFISIIGDSFEKSQDEKVVKNGRDLAELIFEAELLFLWNRKKNFKKFWTVLREEHADLQIQSTPGQRMKKISEAIQELNEISGKNTEEVEEIRRWVDGKINEVLKKSEDILKKIPS